MPKVISTLGVGAMLLVLHSLAASGADTNQDGRTLSSLQSLASGLNSTNPATRFYAVSALGKLAGSETVEPLAKALQDPDACVRLAAAKALGSSADPAAMNALVQILNAERDADVWNMAAKPVLDKGPSEIPVLLECFGKAEALEPRSHISHALRKLGWEPKTQEERIAFYVPDLLDRMGDLAGMGPVVIPALTKLIEEGDEYYRHCVMLTLGSITDSGTLRLLVKGLADPSPDVRGAARWGLRKVCFEGVRKYTGNTGYLLLLACRFLAPLVFGVIILISFLRHRHGVQPGSSEEGGIIAKVARTVWSFDGILVLSAIASFLVCYMHTTSYMKANYSLRDFTDYYLQALFPAIVMIFVLDIFRITSKAARTFMGVPGNTSRIAPPLLWVKRIVGVGWQAGLVYCFVTASLAYLDSSLQEQVKVGPQAPMPDAQIVQQRAHFASIAQQAKEAVKAVDSRYLDRQQKEQVMDTFVKLVSIRSPSKHESRISDSLKQMMEELGARVIDCRRGDTNAPFNLVMEFAASADLKDAPGILLNAHIDTVDVCTPERIEFDKAKSSFYHRDNGSYGNDNKSGVTLVVEAVRTLKHNFWDKGHSHRRILVVLTAEDESGFEGSTYLAKNHRDIFDNLDWSFTVAGMLPSEWEDAEYPQTPLFAGIFKGKENTFKGRQIQAIMEDFAKERNKPIFFHRQMTWLTSPVDAFMFPPETYKTLFFSSPNHGLHSRNRNNVGVFLDYLDMLVNVLVHLEADYANTIAELRTGVSAQ